MRVIPSAFRVILGFGLILHGLGSSVLILRGADATGAGTWNAALTAACVVAVIGFVASGMGVLGFYPFDRSRRALVLAASIGAITAQADLPFSRDLAAGWLLSVVLPIGVFLLPVAPDAQSRSVMWWVRTVFGNAFVLWVAATSVLWPYSRTWGATAADWAQALPGDHQPRTSQFEILHAVTIAAPPARVWERLVQLGQDRAGFYSYDWLERAIGADIHNSADVRPEWQVRAAGDRVFATQPGYLAGVFTDRPGWNVRLVEPGRALVLENWGAFVLVPQGNGTRFFVRSTISNPRIPPAQAAINWVAFEMPHFIMQRRMLLQIKALAEQAGEAGGRVATPAEG